MSLKLKGQTASALQRLEQYHKKCQLYDLIAEDYVSDKDSAMIILDAKIQVTALGISTHSNQTEPFATNKRLRNVIVKTGSSRTIRLGLKCHQGNMNISVKSTVCGDAGHAPGPGKGLPMSPKTCTSSVSAS